MTAHKTLKEFCSIDACLHLAAMPTKEMKDVFFSDIQDEDKNGKKYDPKYLIGKVRAICNNVIKNKGFNTTHYRYANGMTDGRLYAKDGIQALPRGIRKYMTGGVLVDLDMKNAHFSILLNLVKKYNIAHPTTPLSYEHLENYVMNRDAVFEKYNINKHDMLKALYMDKMNCKRKVKNHLFTDNEFVIDFWGEKNAIFNEFIRLKEFRYPETNKIQPKSSYISKVICHYENIALQKACEICERDYCVSILMFDGFMLTRVGNKTLLLEKLNNNDNGIVWVEKDNISDYVPEPQEETEFNGNYHAVKEKFEETRFYIRAQNKYVVKLRNSDGELCDSFHGRDDFKHAHRPYKYFKLDEKDPEYFVEKWFDDDTARAYDDIIFLPYANAEMDTTPPKLYNTFRPFKSIISPDKIEPTQVKWFTDFLFDNICNQSPKVYDFMIKYIATLIQHPEKNQNVCLVMRGEQGCGKDTLAQIMEKLYGKDRNYVYNTSNLDDCFGNFTSPLKDKTLLVLNEAKGKDMHDLKNKLKDITTREHNHINEKYRTAYDQKNLCNLWMFSQNLNIVNIEASDRRFVLLKTGSMWCGKSEYWNDIYKNMNNQNVMNDLITFLYQVDTSTFEAKRDRPKTEEYKVLADTNTPTEIQYFQYLAKGDFPGWVDYKTSKTSACKIIKASTLTALGNEWIGRVGYDYKIKMNKWKLSLSDIDGVNTKFKINGDIYYRIFADKFINNIKKKYPEQADDDVVCPFSDGDESD